MKVASQCSRKVDPVHQSSAEKSAQDVGIVGQNDFRHLRLRFADRARLQLQRRRAGQPGAAGPIVVAPEDVAHEEIVDVALVGGSEDDRRAVPPGHVFFRK